MMLFSSEFTYKSIDVIYGDFRRDEGKTYIRSLDDFWMITQIARVKTVFEKSFDGSIAFYLKEYWKDAANWIERFSNIIDSNVTMQIYGLYGELSDILRKARIKENSPSWVMEISNNLSSINKALRQNGDRPYWVFFNFAKLLWEHKRFVQAVITLNCTVETYITMSADNWSDKNVGKYSFIEGAEYRAEKESIFKRLPSDFSKSIRELDSERNLIAHCGAEKRNKDDSCTSLWNKLPNMEFISEVEFNSWLEAVNYLLKREEVRL